MAKWQTVNKNVFNVSKFKIFIGMVKQVTRKANAHVSPTRIKVPFALYPKIKLHIKLKSCYISYIQTLTSIV